MKRYISALVLSGLLFSGCQQIELTPSPEEPQTFYATIEGNDETKTSLDNNGNVLWKKNDQVSVFDQSTIKETYKVTDDSDGKTSAELTRLTSQTGTSKALNCRVAFYPYNNCNSVNQLDGINGTRYSVSCTLPETQSYAGNSFDNGAFPMVAVTTTEWTDRHFVFKNILGAVKLQLKGSATVKSITISGNNNEILWGSATVTASNTDAPSIALSNASAKTVTLKCGAGVTLNNTTATSFTIALPPMTMTNGFTVTINDNDGKKMVIKTSKSQTINRSGRLVMPEKTYIGVSDGSVDLGLSVLWATCNLGASSPEGYGYYYQWGDTQGYSSDTSDGKYFSWKDTSGNVSYKWCNGSGETLTKYNTNSDCGTVDKKTVLEMADDAARAALGGKWRMPTAAEWAELRNTDNCSWTWTTLNGVNGYKVQSKKEGYSDNWIFLPAAGVRGKAAFEEVGRTGYYWSSSLITGIPSYAYSVCFDSGYISGGIYYDSGYCGYRCNGQSIRPVLGNN